MFVFYTHTFYNFCLSVSLFRYNLFMKARFSCYVAQFVQQVKYRLCSQRSQNSSRARQIHDFVKISREIDKNVICHKYLKTLSLEHIFMLFFSFFIPIYVCLSRRVWLHFNIFWKLRSMTYSLRVIKKLKTNLIRIYQGI